MRVRLPVATTHKADDSPTVRLASASMRAHLDFLAVGLAAFAAVLQTLLFPQAPAFIRIPVSLTFLLLAPGYAVAAALFPQRTDVDGAERLALTLGLSVVSIPLLGLLFNALPWGINLRPMSIGLSAFTLIALTAALQRRLNLEPEQRFFCRYTPFRRPLSLLLGIGLAFAAVVVTAQVLRPPPLATEFYVLGSEGRLEGFPQTLRPGQPFSLVVGVGNHDGETQSYRIQTSFSATTIGVPELSEGQVWEGALRLQAPAGQGRTKLTLELYRADEPTPYRSLELFVTLITASQPLRPLGLVSAPARGLLYA